MDWNTRTVEDVMVQTNSTTMTLNSNMMTEENGQYQFELQMNED